MSARFTSKPSRELRRPSRGRADLPRLRRLSEAEIARTSPPELKDLPEDFWDSAEVVLPAAKRAISLRLDEDVLNWFRKSGRRYQTRINAVLRSYMIRIQKRGRIAGTTKVRKQGVA